ncbi:MAG: DUF2244 domain-containing protein [Pseudomonadota bacterium]
MPYETTNAPILTLNLWPYRSLPRKGFVIFIGATAAMLALPLVTILGSPVVWGLLPFFMAALWAVYAALQRSYRDGELLEELTITHHETQLVRHNPRGPDQSWSANTYWVSVHLHKEGGPVENYVTLKGGGREVEIGSFLSNDERVALHAELQSHLAQHR